MKRLLVTGSLILAVLLSGCATLEGSDGKGFEVTHTDPIDEMTKGACCRI